jgi:peptidoglycan/xylan/chitin deacetylase (PgdA/CDA1 family)
MSLKVAVTHDVDRLHKSYHYFSKIITFMYKKEFKMVYKQLLTIFSKNNSYDNFDEIIQIEKDYNIKATYYFLNETIPFNFFSKKNWFLSLGRYNIKNKRIIDVIKQLKSFGHEIGVHGSYLSYKDEKLLLSEKKILEEILGEEVIGIRQHHLNLDERTWEIQKKCGFLYDTSFGFNRDIGYKDSLYRPFKPMDDFLIFPQVIMDFCFANHKNKWDKLQEIIEQTKKNNAILVLNWHTDTFNENDFIHHKKDFLKIIKILKENNAEFNTLKNYYYKNF